MILETLRQILKLAPEFKKDEANNPAMEQRELLLATLRTEIEAQLVQGNLDPQLLQVRAGGRQSLYSPVPWVRIFDPEHAPTAQTGFYIVLLFAADGSAVYLSLNQGTSEFRSNKMRPILDDDLLLNRTAIARAAIDEWVTRVTTAGSVEVDLRGDSAPVGPESKRRVRNYELANIYSYRYPIAELPTDESFRADLEELLVLLWALENADLNTPTAFVSQLPQRQASPNTSRPSTRQGRQLNEKIRRLIEKTAEDRAVSHYETNGWAVERVGQFKLGYDLKCIKQDVELHVEVKGTSGRGLDVTLTPNEVNHCRSYPHMALVVVSRIEIGDDEIVTDLGVMRLFEPWSMDDTRLTPSEYSYRVPIIDK
jgi:hypothetical protein